jgi:hypothetical protein
MEIIRSNGAVHLSAAKGGMVERDKHDGVANAVVLLPSVRAKAPMKAHVALMRRTLLMNRG